MAVLNRKKQPEAVMFPEQPVKIEFEMPKTPSEKLDYKLFGEQFNVIYKQQRKLRENEQRKRSV